jgi:antirestriction protein ArdC
MEAKFDIYKMINDIIIEKMENGIVPWQKPWNAKENRPMNLVSKKPYRGVNFWLFVMLQHERPYYLSYKQITELGATLKKGSKGFPVVFWKINKYANVNNDGEVEMKTVPYLRYYRVYNVEEVDGLPDHIFPKQAEEELDFKPIQACKNIVENWTNRPVVKHGGAAAYYMPTFDEVTMPQPKHFRSGEEYYSTLFHELVHSTGHKSRLDRHKKFPNHKFGSKDYSQEELVAEMGAAYLCGFAGISNKVIDNSAAYLKSWLKRLQDDKKLFFNAASMAQKAVDYMLNINLSTEE